MSRHPDRIASSCVPATIVLCAFLAVAARGAPRPTGQDDALLGVPDAAAARPEATRSRAAFGGDASAKPPAFRAPLPGRITRDGDVIYAVNDPSESGVFRHPAGLFEIRFPGAWRVMRHISGGYVWYTFSTEASPRQRSTSHAAQQNGPSPPCWNLQAVPRQAAANAESMP